MGNEIATAGSSNREEEVTSFLSGARTLIAAEPGLRYADASTFHAFDDEVGLEVHLTGRIADALYSHSEALSKAQ
jgi:hypothetical protein